MAGYRWNHFLPQMYRRAWIDQTRAAQGNNEIWVYRVGAAPKARGPKGVANESRLILTFVQLIERRYALA